MALPDSIKPSYEAAAAFTITLASLANGSGRASTAIDNTTNEYPAALIYLAIQSGGTAPTVDAVYEVFLLRSDNHASQVADDNWGETDAAITVLNAPALGIIRVTANINTTFYGVFDTSPLGPLGPSWGIAVKNSSGQALNATEGNHLKHYVAYFPEIRD